MALVGVGGAITQIISSVTLAKAGEELILCIRVISFRTILRQEIGWFDADKNNVGALVTRLSSDAASLKGFTGATFSAVLNALGTLITALVISFSNGWKLTLLILSFTPLMVLTGLIQGQQVSRAAGNKKDKTSYAEEGGKVFGFAFLLCLYRAAKQIRGKCLFLKRKSSARLILFSASFSKS